VSKGCTLPTGVAAPILLEGLRVIGKVRTSWSSIVSSIAPYFFRMSVHPAELFNDGSEGGWRPTPSWQAVWAENGSTE
jgi:hypothetical protein